MMELDFNSFAAGIIVCLLLKDAVEYWKMTWIQKFLNKHKPAKEEKSETK